MAALNGNSPVVTSAINLVQDQKRVCEIPGPAGIQIGLSTTVTGRLKGWVTSSGESLAHWAHRDPAHAMITGGEY